MSRFRLLVIAGAVAAITAGMLVIVPSTRARLYAAAQAHGILPAKSGLQTVMQPAPPQPVLRAAPVTVPANPDFERFGWALLDRHTNALVGSDNRESMPNSTESMIKPWLAADYLRRLGGKQLSATMAQTITLMIEDSNDNAADALYDADGGTVSIQRLIDTCKLTETQLGKSWSYTQITPADAARYGRCIGDGTAAGPTWTPWLLDKMRHVRGAVKDQVSQTVQGGHWGIIDALPQELAVDTAIKNGFTYIYADARWHVNCLAVHPDWVLVVEMQFAGPTSYTGLQQGADACAAVTRQLVYTPTG